MSWIDGEMELAHDARLIVLLGLSGTGKTTILRYITSHFDVDSSPKFTTRKSRGTIEDQRDFIFCNEMNYPQADVITFESYGEKFGIQRACIEQSLSGGRCHALIVGDGATVRRLSKEFPGRVVAILVHATLSEIEQRIESDPQRKHRLDEIRSEAAGFYDTVGSVQFVISTDAGLQHTYRAVDDIVGRLCPWIGEGRV